MGDLIIPLAFHGRDCRIRHAWRRSERLATVGWVLVGFAVYTPAASAQDTSAVAPECAKDETTAGIRRCLDLARDRMGARLEDRLAEARRRANQPALLDTAQARWFEFRAVQCRADASQFAGGSLQPIRFLQCWLELTTARIRYLEALFREPLWEEASEL